MDVMSALLGVIERETELVRAGKLREAMQFEPKKTELSRRYVSAVGNLKASQKYLTQQAPERRGLAPHALRPGLPPEPGGVEGQEPLGYLGDGERRRRERRR